jgi:hypothetical protein
MTSPWGREIGGMLQGTGIAGRSFQIRPWLKMGCSADDGGGGGDDDVIYHSNFFFFFVL